MLKENASLGDSESDENTGEDSSDTGDSGGDEEQPTDNYEDG